jgi:polycystin 1L2
VDLSLIGFSFTAFAIWLYRLWEAQRVMNQTSVYSTGHSGNYINLQMLAYWDDVLSSMLAICAFLGTIKFLHILQFNSTIRTLFRTLGICVNELVSFGIIFLVTVFAFIQAAFVKFNDNILGLSTFFKSVETGFLLMLGKFQLSDMLAANPVCSVIFYMTFNVFVIMVLLNMFVSMISDAFEQAKEEEKNGDPLGLENYLYEKIAKFFGSVREKSSLGSGSDAARRDREEQQMMASVSHQGKYMDQADQFNYKTTKLLRVLKSVTYLFSHYSFINFNLNSIRLFFNLTVCR